MDYMDADVAYLLGLIVAQGTLSASDQVRQLTIEFPYPSLHLHGETSEFDQETEISLGLHNVRSRLVNLLHLVIARWDPYTKSLDYASVITGNDNVGRI